MSNNATIKEAFDRNIKLLKLKPSKGVYVHLVKSPANAEASEGKEIKS